jgi:7-keto-8-aminopelargonate synthetase-like enzyme
MAANDVAEAEQFELSEVITKATLFKILVAHSRAVITMISDNNPEDIDKISEHKKYLRRSLPGSFQEISDSKTYLKSVEVLDRKLLRRNITI